MQQQPHSLERQQKVLAKANRQEPLSTYEIAELCMVSRSAVQQTLRAAHENFRRAFESECSGGELAELQAVLDQFEAMQRATERGMRRYMMDEYDPPSQGEQWERCLS